MNTQSPSQHHFISLGTKFILLVVFILLTTMSVASYFNVQMQKRMIVEQLTAKAHSMGSFISLISADAILGYDFLLLDRYMEEISHQPDVVYGVIISPDNVSLSSYINKSHPFIAPVVKEGADSLMDIVSQVNNHDGVLSLTFNINNEDAVIGSVIIGLSTERADELSNRVLKEHLVEIMIIILFLSLCIYYVFKRSALRPIQDLITSSEKLAKGDANARANIISNDELGTLASSFNQMADSLNRSQQEKDNVVDQLLNVNKSLEMATRAKSAFLANMSHEIRTPLTAIIGFGDYLQDPDITSGNRSKAVDSIVQNGLHLQHIINDILDLSKVEAEKLELEKIEVNLFELIQHVETLVSIQTRECGLSHAINYQFPLPEKIVTDPLRYKQILINICNNAIKFTEKGSVDINISYQENDNMLRVDVNDTGIGLEINQVDKIFEPFTQADSSTSRKYGGTGLGLPLSRKLATILGGNITVKSVPQIGSCFTILINPGDLKSSDFVDCIPVDLHDSFKESKIMDQFSLRGKVLLAEDVIDNQRLISIYIQKTGAEVDIANNGEEAVKAALAQEYDLILMDMQMPVMDGIQAVKKLRSNNYDGTIVALTANAMKEDELQCREAGCDDFLPKPIDRHQFVDLLTHYLTIEKIDYEAPIDSIMDDDDNDFQEIIDMFIDRLPLMFENIKDAYTNNDWEQLSRHTHEMKGVSGSLGFPSVMDVALDIENDVKNELHSGIERKIEKLSSLIKRVIAGKALREEKQAV